MELIKNMLKKFTLWLLRYMLNRSSFYNRQFRIDVCKEIHYYHKRQFNEQTGLGRFYDACGDMFEAAPELMLVENWDVKGGVNSMFDEVKQELKKEIINKPRRNKLKRILNKTI